MSSRGGAGIGEQCNSSLYDDIPQTVSCFACMREMSIRNNISESSVLPFSLLVLPWKLLRVALQ